MSLQSISEEVKKRINASFEKLYYKNTDDEFVPYVCVVCDKILKHTDVVTATLKMLYDNKHVLCAQKEMKLTSNIKKCYEIEDKSVLTHNSWIKKLFLSPRSPFLHAGTSKHDEGFTCCRSCKYGLDRKQMPKYAIVNGYCFGTPPPVIAELTTLERALLTPVQTWGYCFTYTGGREVSLQGSMTYYKVLERKKMKGNLNYNSRPSESIIRAVARMDALGLNNDIVIILHGWMTPEQKKRALKTNSIRVDKVIAAIKWLIENNQEWSKHNFDYETIKSAIQRPVIIDRTKQAEGSTDSINQNIEKTETFHVYFPDGDMTDVSGGQADMEQFRKIVELKKMHGYDTQVQCDIQSKYVYDYKDNNFVNSCLMQFPYGRGGLHEYRIKGDGSATTSTDIEEYIQHLARISQLHFHEELFCLQMYNMDVRNHMLKTATWRVRGGVNSAMIANELTEASVRNAIDLKKQNQHIPDRNDTPGSKFVKAIDTAAQHVPHTNEAAKKAQRAAQAIHYEYGHASWFLTVTPDDDNSFLMQVYSRTDIDLSDLDMTDITNEEATKRSHQRTTLRIKFPGISALFFEDALNIVIKDVLGWDLKTSSPVKGCQGLFGRTEAFTASIEEQGRGTLHVHFLIWSESFGKIREDIHSESPITSKNAVKQLKQMIDNVATSKLVGTPRNIRQRIVPHKCTGNHGINLPKICSDALLRHMRHQEAYVESLPQFASCNFCQFTCSDFDITKSYLKNVCKIPNFDMDTDLLSNMKARCIAYQAGHRPVDDSVVHAAYDKHIHTKSCFRNEKVPKRKRKTECALHDYECRFRFPKRQKKSTEIKPVLTGNIRWYQWDGSYVMRDVREINIKRSPYDAFQNESCIAVAGSRLTCNTNVSALFPGPVSYYTFKYNMKGTQDDDEKGYERVLDATKKTLALEQHQRTNNSIAVSRLLRASMAHQKTNVIGGTLASYLTRKKSRFIMSHESVFCPVSDIKKALRQEKTFSTIQQVGKTPFYESGPLNYICRPSSLENISLRDFFSKYLSVKLTKRVENDEEFWPYINLPNRQHPSFHAKRNRFYKCVQKREKPVLIQVNPYSFPDTAEIGGCLQHPETLQQNETTEKYCESVLIVFYHYRQIEDIQIDGSYTKKLVNILQTTGFPDTINKVLQNIQDFRANAMRYKISQDDLQRCTTPFESSEKTNNGLNDMTEEEELKEEIDLLQLQQMIQYIEDPEESMQQPGVDTSAIPESLQLSEHINRARFNGGTRHIATMLSDTIADSTNPFIVECTDTAPTPMTISQETNNDNQLVTERTEIDFMRIILERTSRRDRTSLSALNEHINDERLEANGSLESIMDWGKCANFDNKQRRAFEIFTATFVMSFFREAVQVNNVSCEEFVESRSKLLHLLETTALDHQLICFLHGPGGSGKTTVIDLLIEYAKEFCSFIPGFVFTSRTITTTAMTGVAATLIGGETIHSALYFNTKFGAEEIQLWSETRMLIVDEISFSSGEQLKLTNTRLMALKQNNKPYGGLDIIFSGDMRQLEPCGRSGNPIYDSRLLEFHDWINCYICLEGMHRYNKDKQWGYLLRRLRDGEATLDDIATINSRVVQTDTALPDNIRYATFFNKERDSINAALYQKHCEIQSTTITSSQDKIATDSIVVFSSEVNIRDHHKKYVTFKNSHHFWETCGECDIKDTGRLGRMDPCLRIYTGCKVMFPFNKDVPNGIANGTQGTVQRIHLRHNTPTRYVNLPDGTRVQAVYASEVKSVEVKHINGDITPNVFSVEPIQYYATVDMLKPKTLQTKRSRREIVHIKCTQIPLIVNNATTGHKLQGVGVENLFVHEWKYSINWAYVILSRVKTLNGLYLRRPIDNDLERFRIPRKLTTMLEEFETRQPTFWSNRKYRMLCRGIVS